MNDCSNAEMRDQLPDLLHERLEESARAVVIAHVATCIDCRDELQLLRDVLGMIETRTPRVNVGLIVSALPKPPVVVDRRVTPIASRRRVWADWRVAAAVTLLVAGGSSAALLKRGATPGLSDTDRVSTVAAGTNLAVGSVSTVTHPGTADSMADSVTIAKASAATAVASTSGSTGGGVSGEEAVASPDDHAGADLGNGSRLGDLSEAQLQKLLMEIDNLPATPVTDPEPVSLHVNSQVTSSEGT